MSKFAGVRCDECGTIKKDTNHWYRAKAGESSYVFLICRADSPLSDGPGDLDLCSASCASKAMSKAIGVGSTRGEDVAVTKKDPDEPF